MKELYLIPNKLNEPMRRYQVEKIEFGEGYLKITTQKYNIDSTLEDFIEKKLEFRLFIATNSYEIRTDKRYSCVEGSKETSEDFISFKIDFQEHKN